MDLERVDYKIPDIIPAAADGLLSECPTYREMVNNAFVFVHQTLHQANRRLQKRGGRTMSITPRHFLDFIAHYDSLIKEKRTDLEEQQLHLNIGLQKIKETVEQVEVMQKSLRVKRQELEVMNEAANAKLKQMVQDQQEAEQKKTHSQQLQDELAKQDVFIREKRSLVMDELSQVEPAVEEAKHAVNDIKRAQLVEIRSLGNPPAIVKLVLESIFTMLGEAELDWKSMRSYLFRDNFIPSIGIRKKDIQEIRAMKNPPPAVKMALEAICLLLGERTTDWRQILALIVKDTFVPSIINFNTDDIRLDT
ncbi:unnamed protein product [Protopolystoma xenopodis]|uniref:Dynein heavy chain coiled coil stalk domain-containing protein n=1 Tax=Protopolystoma xenopodis TaxID=117903 RepID=A0A3S5ADG1_9PLAT|nr:unnamed protein product [Protopolystoma xenopodis]